MFDLGGFPERAPIADDCGRSCYATKTFAAKNQDMSTWGALNAVRVRNLAKAQHQRPTPDGDAANDLPDLQSGPEEED